MQVIIMRHGDAVFKGAERVLSAKGEQEARLTGLKLASAFHITKIFCSSKTRALQTANIVHDLLRGREVPPVQVLNELAPYGNTDLAVDYIESICEENDTVLLVSHIPQVVCLSTAFCQRELELPTFFTAGALILESKGHGQAFVPSQFLTANRELKLQAIPTNTIKVPTAAAAAVAVSAGAAGVALWPHAANMLSAYTSVQGITRHVAEPSADQVTVLTSNTKKPMLHSQRVLAQLSAATHKKSSGSKSTAVPRLESYPAYSL